MIRQHLLQSHLPQWLPRGPHRTLEQLAKDWRHDWLDLLQSDNHGACDGDEVGEPSFRLRSGHRAKQKGRMTAEGMCVGYGCMYKSGWQMDGEHWVEVVSTPMHESHPFAFWSHKQLHNVVYES